MVLKTGMVFFLVFWLQGSLTLSHGRWRAALEPAPPSVFSQGPWSSTHTSVIKMWAQIWLTGPVNHDTALPDLNTRTPAWWGQVYTRPSWSPWSSYPGRSSHTGSEDSGKHIIIIIIITDFSLMNKCLWWRDAYRGIKGPGEGQHLK